MGVIIWVFYPNLLVLYRKCAPQAQGEPCPMSYLEPLPPGPQVTVYGIIRCMPTSGGMSAGGDRQAPNKSLYILYLEVKAVVNNRHWDEFI